MPYPFHGYCSHSVAVIPPCLPPFDSSTVLLQVFLHVGLCTALLPSRLHPNTTVQSLDLSPRCTVYIYSKSNAKDVDLILPHLLCHLCCSTCCIHCAYVPVPYHCGVPSVCVINDLIGRWASCWLSPSCVVIFSVSCPSTVTSTSSF